jgi:hypothetical protein
MNAKGKRYLRIIAVIGMLSTLVFAQAQSRREKSTGGQWRIAGRDLSTPGTKRGKPRLAPRTLPH